MTIDFRFRHWFHLSVAFALLVAASFAQGQQPQINTAVDASQRKVIGNSVHPLAARANDLGRADGGTSMKDILLMLHPSDAQAATLKKYVDDLHNPSSKSFHKWLTPDQYAARFGAADADVKTVSDWLASNGFSVDKVARGKNWIRFSGTSSQVESAFQTSVHKYAVNGETKYANATSLSIPAALAPAVSGVVRVNNFLSQPQHVAPDKITRDKNGKLVRVSGAGTAQTLSGSASKTASPAFTNNGDQVETYLTPGDFSKIYDAQSVVASGVDGTGVSIAIVGRSDIAMSDVEAFRTISGLPFNDPNIVYATTDPGVVPGDDVEASLDVEWAGAIAPRATINYVIGASTNTTDGVDVAASHIVDGAISPIMTVSFGLCEADMSDTQVAFYQLLWEQAASEGITVFVSSGDAGSSGCNAPSNASTVYGFGVSGLASTAYNTDNAGTKKIKLTLNLSGTSFTLGQQTQYSVSVASATTGSTSSPIGYVTLYSGYGQIAGTLSLSGGKATGTVAWDAVGTQSVYAVYGGDGNYGSGNSAATTVTVAQATPTVTVQPLASYVAVGGQTSLTALLSSPLSTSNVQAPTGSIVFFDSVNGHAATQIGRAQALANGNGGTILATIAPVLAAGSNVITAVYSGDVNWKSTTSAATTPILVTAPGFTETATPNPLTLTAGQTASLTVTTQSILSFSSQIALSCGGTLPEGVTCNSTTTAPGGSATLSLTATAPGTTSTNTSLAHNAPWLMFSGTVTMAGLFLICIPNRRRFAHLSMILLALALVGGVVGCGGGSGAKPTTLVLTSSNSKVASGASVNLQAIVQSANPNNLKGVITFYDGSTAIGSPTAPTNGVATLATSSLSVGTHAITAKFAGDSHDTASASSDVLDQTVTGGFTLTVNATSGTLSQSISVPATLQ